MPKRRRIILVLVCGCLLAAAAFKLLTQSDGPRHAGHSLRYWVYELGDDNSSEHLAAGDAIRRIGTNAVPYLQKWVLFEHTPHWISVLDERLRALGIYLDLQGTTRTEGPIRACRVLGPDAIGVIQHIERQMYDPDLVGPAGEAAGILPQLGKEAIPALTRFLTNQDRRLHFRYIAIQEVRAMGSDAKPLVPILIQCLQDRSKSAAASAATALGELNLDRTVASAALAKALQDTDKYVREAATNALLKIAPEALTNSPPP
jgi:hypothetical protein